MVPSDAMRDELRTAYAALRGRSVNVNDYAGEQHALAFDLVTVDTFVGGIASRLLDGESVTKEERNILRLPFIRNGIWQGHEVRNAPLTHNEQILEYAEAIEKTRNSEQGRS